MATVADLKEEIPKKKIQAEKEETDGEFQHPNVTSSDDIGEMVDATVTDSNIITKDTVTEDTLDADHVKLPGEPKGEILCKTPELVQDSSGEAGQKETDLQETEIEMLKEKQACTLKDGLDKDTSADVPVKIIIESNHDIILASQDIEHVKIAASSISSRDCQETEAVTTVESIKEEVQRSNVIEEILPSEDNWLKNGSIIDSELEKEGNVSDSMVNLKTMVTTEQKEYKSVVEEDSIVKTDDPSAIQHIERSQDDANKKDERDAYAVETVDEVRKNQIATPSTLETKNNQVATPSEIIEIKVPQNSEMASNFQASIEDDQQKDQYVNDINDTAVETGASGEQMLEESYATKDVKVKADAECSNMKESASADKPGSTEAVSDEHFETSITTISIEKVLTDRSTSYSEDNFPKAVESNQGKTAAGDELKHKEDFDILLVSESAAKENFQVERTQDLGEVASMKEKEKPEAVAEVSYIVIDEKEKTDEALPSTESTEEKTCQLNETSIFKNVDESSSSEPSVPSNIKNDEKEDDIHKEELVEDRNIHANLHRDDHEDEKLDKTLDTCETVGDDAGAMHPENTHGEIKNDQFKTVESETNDTNKDKAKAEEAEAAYTESENALSQEVSSSSINDHHEATIQEYNISIPGEDQIFSSHKLDEEIGDVKDSQDQEISREDCEKEYQNLNRKNTGNQHADAELVTQDSADKICNNSQETQLENLDKVPDTRSKNQSHEKTSISSVEDGETTCIPSVSGILKNDMQSDIVEETVILRNERESLNQETLAGERDTYSLPREDENEKGQTGASFNEAFVEKKNNSSEVYEEQGTMKNTLESVHGNQDIREKDLIEEEATYASSNKLEEEIDANPSCTSKPLTETIDHEKEVEDIHASSEKILDKTVATVVLTSKPLDGTLAEEKEVETMHARSEQLPDESVASSFINNESQKEITEGDKDHLIHSDQSSKTENVLEEIEDDRHFKDDQISITEHLVKEVYPTNVEAESQETDIKSPGSDESAEELNNNTQEVVPSSDHKLASETIESNQSSKDIAPIEAEDEENTFALQTESTAPSSDFSREQTYQSDKSPVHMTLDPTAEFEIAEGSTEEELPNKECLATTTSDTDIEWKGQTESLTCEVDVSSLEKKNDHEERKTDIELKGTCDDAHNVDGEPCAEDVHITNTEEIILDEDTGLESVKEVDKCIYGDQDNKVKDLTGEEEATYASPSCTSKPLTETIDPEKEVEAIHASNEKILDKTVATVVLTSKQLDGILEEEKEVETMHADSEQPLDESFASSIINEESQKEIMEGDKDHLVHSDQSFKTDEVLEEIEDDRHFKDDQMSVTGNLVKEVNPTNVEAEIQEADIKSPGIDESSEELTNNTQQVVPSSDLKLASETMNSNQSSKDIAPIETKDEENTFASDFSREQTYESNKSTVDMTLDPTGEIEIAEEELLNKECCATTTSDTDIVTNDQTESLTCEVETSSLEKKDDHEERETDIELKGTWDDAHNVDGGPCAEEVHITNTEEIILDGDTGLESVKEVDECIHGDQDNKIKDLKEEEEATYASGDKLEDDIDASSSCTSKPLTETIDPEKEVEAIHASSEIFLDKTVATVVLTSKPLDGILEEEKEVETMHAGSEQLPDESVASSIINDESQKEIMEGDKDHLVHSDQSSKTEKVLEEVEDDKQFKEDQIPGTEHLVKEVHPTNVEGESQKADTRSPRIEESTEELSNNTQEVVHSSDLKVLVKEVHSSEHLVKEVHPTNVEAESQEADIRSPEIEESTEELSNNTQEVVHSSDLKFLVKEVHSSEHLVKEVHPTNVEAESQEADIRSPGIEESTEELSNNTQEVVYSSDLKLASETTDSDQSSKDIAAIEAEDEENTFALQSESTAPSFDFSREQTYQSNKTPVDMMLDKQCHATTTLDSDIESKDQTESLTCEVETSSFEKKDDHEEREIDIQLKGTCDDVQNVAGGPCAEEVHIKNTEEIILDADTRLESVKQVDVKGTCDNVQNAAGGPCSEVVHIKNTEEIILDADTGLESVKQMGVKCTHGDQDMVKDDLKEVEESDHGSIEKSMYEEAFMEDNAFHFSPKKHEEDQFTSAHKAQDEAREKELADYSSKQENIVVKKVHDKGVGSENDPNSRTSTDNEEASRSITYGEKEGDTEKQIESLNPEPGDLPVVQTLFMKSLNLDDQKNDEGVEDPKTSRVEEIINTGDHSTVEDPKEDLENKNVQEILHERDEKEIVQTSLDFLVEKEGKNLLGIKVPIKGDMEQPTSMEFKESAERVGTGTITKEEFTEFSKDINITALMGEIKGRCQQAMEKDSLNEIDTTKMEGLKVQEFGIAREQSRIESEKVELRKENGNNGNGVGNDDNSKMQEEPEEGNPTDEKIDKKFYEKMQNQTERDGQSAGMLHADIVEEYSVIENLNFSEQNVNSVDSVKCKEETKDVEEQHTNMVSVPAFLESATKETFEEKEKPEAAFCAATPSTEGKIIEKEKGEAEVATTELFNTIPTTNNGTSNEKGQRMNVFEGEEKKNSDDSTITKDKIFEEGGCDLKTSPLMDRNETDGDKGDGVEIKMTHEQDLAPLVTAQSNSEVLDCNKLNIAEEKDEGTSKNLSSLSTTEPIEGTICKDRGQEVPEDTSLVHNDDADPNKFMKEDESTVLMASQLIVTEGLLPAEEKVPTPKEEDACTVDNYLPVSQFLLNLIHEEFPDDENTKADNLKQEDIVPKDYIKTETRTEEDNTDSMELPVSNSSLMLEEKKHDFCERAEDGNAEGMEEFKKLSDSPNKREIDKDTNDDNFLLSEFAESRHGDLKILNDGAKEELTIVSESGIKEDMSSTHPSYDEKIYEQKTPEEHAIESRLDKNIDVQEVDSKDEEILKQESNDSEDKIESQPDNEMINEARLENKASVVIQPEEIKELEDSINNKGTLPNTQGVEQTKVSHSEIYVDDLQLRSTDTVEKIKEEVAEDQTTKMETLTTDEKEPHKNLDAVEQKNSSEDIIICVDPKEVQSNVETVDKAMEDQKAFSAIKSAEVKYAESLVAREIEVVLPEVKTLSVTELEEATDPECIPICNIVERDTDKKSTTTTDEECLTTIEIVEKVKEEDETSTTIKSGDKDAENFNGSEETAQSNQFQVAEVLGYVVVQGQKQGEIFENESEFVKETEKEEKAQMNINIKESSSGDLKESYLSMENQTDMQKRAVEDKNQNAESYLERKEIKDSTVKEEKIEEAKNESSGQNVTEESGHETAPLIEMKEGKHSPPNKKHGNILSGVRSKVKQSISSVKKAITCSSSVSHLIHEGN